MVQTASSFLPSIPQRGNVHLSFSKGPNTHTYIWFSTDVPNEIGGLGLTNLIVSQFYQYSILERKGDRETET